MLFKHCAYNIWLKTAGLFRLVGHHMTEPDFRIGAATSAALCGIPEWTIRAMGRWKSDCVHRYIRTDPATFHRVASRLSAVARHSWTLHWPWYVNYMLWSQCAHYGLCGAWGAFGLAQFYRLQLARLINLQRIAHSDYTVTLPPSISTRGLLVHCLLSQSHSHLTPSISTKGLLVHCLLFWCTLPPPPPPLSTRGLLVHCLLYCSTLSSSRPRVGCTLPVARTQHPTKPSLVSVWVLFGSDQVNGTLAYVE